MLGPGHGWAWLGRHGCKIYFYFQSSCNMPWGRPQPHACCGRAARPGKKQPGSSQAKLLVSICLGRNPAWGGCWGGQEGGEGWPSENPKAPWLQGRTGGGEKHQGCVAHVWEPGTVLGIFRGDPNSEISRSPLASNSAVHYALIYCQSHVSSFPVLWVGLCHCARALTSEFFASKFILFWVFLPF